MRDFFNDFLVSGRREKGVVVARQLKAGNFDACILLTGSLRTAWPVFLARIKHRIGYRRSGRTPLLTAHWPRPRVGEGGKKAPYPTKLLYLDLAKKLGADGDGPLKLGVSARDNEIVAAWMQEHGIADDEPLVGLCVGAAYGPSKVWPARHFAAVADHVAETYGARPVVLCAPGEEQLGAEVAALATRPLIDTGPAPLPIDGLKALIARSRALVTNDTGPRHIAAALGTPVVCLLGPMPAEYTDMDVERQIVLREPVECSPCHQPVCTVDGHPCLANLAPERVFDALRRLWDTRC